MRSAARAVGGACGANRIALVIPCHRVVGSRGALGGFMNAERTANGIAIKRWLLRTKAIGSVHMTTSDARA